MTDTGPLEQHLARLSARFAERTTEQLTEQLEALRAWRSGVPHESLQDALIQLLHRLAGSAGTFGQAELGQRAAELEQRLKTEHTDPAQAGLMITELTAELEQLLQLLGKPLPPAAVTATSPSLPVADGASELLVLGAGLDDLAIALRQYGFATRHEQQVTTLPASCWHEHGIIITRSQHLQEVSEWNRYRAGRAGKAPAPLLCAGAEQDFATHYRLAELGVDGLFSLPVDVPALAERIEQLNREHQQHDQARVLLMDDDEELAEHYRLVLTEAGMEVRVLNRPYNMMSTLAEFHPDILLMDIHMPPYSGTTLARMIRFEPQWLSLPIIYLSSEQDRERQLSALAQGADEFITKPISDSLLIRTVSILCHRARQLSRLLARDGLTGLLNHPHSKQALSQEHARVQRMGHHTMVAMLDLDHFKKVNDNHGHATGDRVISTLAHLLQRRLRKTDSLGRYGGEEFVAILPECDAPQACTLFEQICRDFAALKFRGQEQEFSVTVSVGLASLNDFSTAEEALNAADQALYERKRLGRNGVTDYAVISAHKPRV